ncbi:MAG: hypothetical protein ACRD5K_13390 [Candidatus Acidiferrales bacterium]
MARAPFTLCARVNPQFLVLGLSREASREPEKGYRSTGIHPMRQYSILLI